MQVDLLQIIRALVKSGVFQLTLHAEKEREEDQLTIEDIITVLGSCELIEDYPDDPRGHSCLVMGMSLEGKPVHLVCAPKPGQALIIITVYIPSMPKWKSPRERNR